jgi:hypothetical protein
MRYASMNGKTRNTWKIYLECCAAITKNIRIEWRATGTMINTALRFLAMYDARMIDNREIHR